MSQEYTPVAWVDEEEGTPGTLINKARLDQMQTAHHFADGFEEVDNIPTADPGVDYHKIVYCTVDKQFYRWTGSAWEKDIDDDTKALLLAHEADHSNPHQVTKAQVGLGNVDDKGTVSSWQQTPDDDHIPTEKLTKDSLDGKVDKLVTKPTAGTYTSVTINAEGQVTGGSNPTTLAGYGITDAVNTTGDQTGIAGAKTWTGVHSFTQDIGIYKDSEPSIALKNTSLSRGTVPTANMRFGSVRFTDGANATLGEIISMLGTDGSSQITFDVVKNQAARADVTATITYPASGNAWMTAPSRTYNSANVNDIVTIGSLASNPNVVHTTGNEYNIAGEKRFSSVIQRQTAIPTASTVNQIGSGLQFYSASNVRLANLYIQRLPNGKTTLNVELINSDGSTYSYVTLGTST